MTRTTTSATTSSNPSIPPKAVTRSAIAPAGPVTHASRPVPSNVSAALSRMTSTTTLTTRSSSLVLSVAFAESSGTGMRNAWPSSDGIAITGPVSRSATVPPVPGTSRPGISSLNAWTAPNCSGVSAVPGGCASTTTSAGSVVESVNSAAARAAWVDSALSGRKAEESFS